MIPSNNMPSLLKGGSKPYHYNGIVADKHSQPDATIFSEIQQFKQAFSDELRALRVEFDTLKQYISSAQLDTRTEAIDNDRAGEIGVSSPDHAKVCNNLSTGTLKPFDRAESTILPLSSPLLSREDNCSQVELKAPVGQEKAAKTWQPAYIHSLRVLENLKFPHAEDTATFSWEFISTLFFGAVEHSPGLFHIPSTRGSNLLPSRTFYAMNPATEPYIPRTPGEHGAKMTPFFNPVYPGDGNCDPYICVPLFVAASTYGGKKRGDNEWIYYGMYTQSRWSDKMSSTEMEEHVSKEIKEYWAEQLADMARPDWVTKALMKHFVPMPEYDGAMPTTLASGSSATDDDGAITKRMRKDVKNFVEDLQQWEREARVQIGLMKPEDMLKSFDRADLDTSPGLRLWWEYLECVGWDEGFYEMLLMEQKRFGHR